MTFKSAFYRTYNYLRMLYGGGKFSSLPDVKYSIYFKKSKDSKIQIGKGFTFFSGNGLNPLSPGRKGTIFTEGNALISIGDNVGMSSAVLWAKKEIIIGNRVTVGANAVILDSDCHSLNYLDRGTENDMRNCKCKPIIIEDDVLIGTGSYILKGVHIGARSIIGAGSIVTSDIPADSIAAGNPARVIRKINQK